MTEDFSLVGRLSEVRFAELILKLSERKETGVLHLWRSGIEKHVYFQEGKLVFARSNDPDERLGVLFLRKNKITYRQMVDAAQKVVPGKRLGTILVLDGYITPSDLYQGVIDQIKEILYSVFEWEEGQYEFTTGTLPTDEVITLNLSTSDIILSGVNRVWRWSWVKSGSISLDAVFRKRDGWLVPVRKMTMTPEMQALLDLLDRPRTLEEILQNSKVGNFETCKLMWGMLLLGVSEQILNAPSWVSDTSADTEEMAQTARIKIAILPEPPPHQMDVRETTAEMSQIKIEEKVEAPPQEEKAEATIVIDRTEAPAEEEKPEATVVMHTAEAPPQETPVASAEPEQPVSESVEDLFAEEPVAAAESAPKPLETETHIPPADLSFSDLADLTDAGEQSKAVPVQEDVFEHAWEKQVPSDIKSLNEQHRYLFEMLRLELGAGVNPFLSKMVKKVSTKYPLVFDGVRLNDFGEFEEASLTSNIEGNLVETYRNAFQYLMREEMEMIQTFLDKKRVASIENGLARIVQKQGVIT